jgi:hypothetical protein
MCAEKKDVGEVARREKSRRVFNLWGERLVPMNNLDTAKFHVVCALCFIVPIVCFGSWGRGHWGSYTFGFATVLFGLVSADRWNGCLCACEKKGQFVPWLFAFSAFGFVYWIAGAPVSH